MTLFNQFNDRLNQRDNYLFRNKNNAIIFDIAIIIKCEDICYNEQRNAISVLRRY